MPRRILLLALSLAAVPVWAKTLSQTLPNGLKVIVKEDRRAPVAVSQIWYKVGSIDEQAGKTGLSHALEHMMFKGTPSVPSGEFNRRIAELGGQNNAYTNRSETVYYENIAAAKLPEVLKLEADRMQNLNFSDKDFANEMNVIREERRQRTEDNPSGKLWEHVYLNSFTVPALRAPIIGYMDDLHTLKADDLRAWYKQWYAPNNATLVIVGDVNAAATLKTAAKLFGGIPAKTLPARNNPIIALSYRVPKLEKSAGNMPYALDVLSDILGGNSSSRLDKNLVRGKQVALNADVGYDLFNREMPLFSIMAMPNDGVSEQSLLAAIRAEIKDIADNGVGSEELKRVKTRMEASEIYARDSMVSQASLMGLLETRGFKYSDEAAIRRRLRQVSAADVQAAAKLLTDSRSSVVTVRPETARP